MNYVPIQLNLVRSGRLRQSVGGRSQHAYRRDQCVAYDIMYSGRLFRGRKVYKIRLMTTRRHINVKIRKKRERECCVDGFSDHR